MDKSGTGNFFEDFRPGQAIRHASPRTVTSGDQAIYTALYGARFALQLSVPFARGVGYPGAPLDDLLVFHMVFGQTVADISVNAVANLGLADCRFLQAVYPGDTLAAASEVIGRRETSSGNTGIVYVRTVGSNQRAEPVLSYIRWVLLRKRDASSRAPVASVPELPAEVDPAVLGGACPPIDPEKWDSGLSGSLHRYGDYHLGEKIDHIDGVTVEEAEHQMAARLYQNNARVHFNGLAEERRLVYGGHAMSLARALSFNGLGNAFHLAAINAARHVAPLYAGDTVFAWSEIAGTAELPGRRDVGALRIVTRAGKNRPYADHHPAVILEIDYWALLPR